MTFNLKKTMFFERIFNPGKGEQDEEKEEMEKAHEGKNNPVAENIEKEKMKERLENREEKKEEGEKEKDKERKSDPKEFGV